MRNWISTMVLASLSFASYGQEFDMEIFQNIAPRNIGPAGMSGRVTSIDVVLKDTDIIFIGTAAGGVWQSKNAGHTWTPIFDDEDAASIGDIEIYQKNPDIMYVGTGEGNPRNSQNSGLGMYKTIDGGKSWTHLGLELSRQIHRVIVHPDNPDIVIAGVSGATWGESEHRGIYRSVNGGKSWEKVLFVNDRTGVADLVAHPENPNLLLAALWEHRRWPWFFKSGGPGSSIYLSSDGGLSWKRLTSDDGLPKGDLGRIGLAYSPVDGNIAYAYIESDDNAIFASMDGGYTWSRRSKPKDALIGDRPFYYADIYADTRNENRLYSIASTVTVSQDGGRTWNMFAPGNKIHTDHHAFWMHPEDPDFIMIGHDGGLNITHDRGKNWWFADNLPLGQFYHVRVDNEIPYNITGGLQDNGSWMGPSQTWFKGGIRNMYWQRLSVGDGFDVVPDPLDPAYGYAMGQAGNLVRYHRPSGQLQPVRPIHPDGEYLRFNWNAGIGIDPVDQKTIYYGSQYIHRSRDHGASWEIISPDLTTNDPAKQKFLRSGGLTFDVTGAEFHTTIISIDPSPLDQQIIWAGSDDGMIHVSTDGGLAWVNVSNGLEGAPENTWVAQVNASQHDQNEAFAVLDDHRRNNWQPYLFRTKDMGKTWKNVVDEDDVRGFVLCHEQDPLEPRLHFLGTEFGLYVSFDDATSWHEWNSGYPTVPTSDLVIHPRDHDLVIATFGRSFWVLDDIRPLRALAKEGNNILANDVYLFDIPPTYAAVIGESIGYRDGKIGDALYNGENRAYGSLISYYLKRAPENAEGLELDKKVRVDIFDMRGKIIRTLYANPKEGLNRIAWELDKNRFRLPGTPKPKKESAPRGGISVPPGEYLIQVTYNDVQVKGNATVLKDPRLEIADQDLVDKAYLIEELEKEIQKATSIMDEVRTIEESVRLARELADHIDIPKQDLIHMAIDSASMKIREIHEMLSGEDVQGIYRDPQSLQNKLSRASSLIFQPWQPKTPNQEVLMKDIRNIVANFERKVNLFKRMEIARLTKSVQRLDLKPFTVQSK